MKPILPPYSLITGLLIILILFSGCNNDGDWKDEGIHPKLRNELAALNEQLIAALKSGKQRNVEMLCSDSLLKFRPQIPKLMTATFLKSINNRKFHIQNDFQINGKPGGNFVVKSGTGANAYTLKFISYTHENLITLGYFEDSLESTGMLTIWGKFPEGWRLNALRFGPFKVLHEDAVYWYGKAQVEYNDDDMIDASIHLSLAFDVLNPAEDYFIYDKDAEIRSLAEQMRGPANRMFKLPLEMTTLPVRPVLVKISPYLYQKKCVPAFFYMTHFPLSDTAALARECDAVHEEAQAIFKGVNEKNKVNVYRACTRKPFNDQDTSYYYEMVRLNDRYHWYNND